MARRGIPADLVHSVLAEPDQVVPEFGSTVARQSRVVFPEGREYLLRVIVNETVDPAVVVTVYRTSRIGKYWRLP
jgi:hypothetical protein